MSIFCLCCSSYTIKPLQLTDDRLLDTLVVECWQSVREVPSLGPLHTKNVIKMVPVVPLFSSQY